MYVQAKRPRTVGVQVQSGQKGVQRFGLRDCWAAVKELDYSDHNMDIK